MKYKRKEISASEAKIEGMNCMKAIVLTVIKEHPNFTLKQLEEYIRDNL